MSESIPPMPPPLDLPPATLNAPSKAVHPDSAEALQYGRHRVAQELDLISPGVLRSTGTVSRTSLRTRGPQSSAWGPQRRPSSASTAADTTGTNQSESRSRDKRARTPWYALVTKFWTTEISVTVDDGDPRDYLGKTLRAETDEAHGKLTNGALERTFLAYLRTSLALAMTGVIIAQLFRLQHSVNPNPEIGFYVIGVPLAASFIALGVVVLLIGAFRFWRQQRAMLRGKVHAGGWELTAIMMLTIVVSGVLLSYLCAT